MKFIIVGRNIEVTPVSYTHLDVYKRQLSDCGVCLHDSYMGIGAGIADGGCSDLCSGIQAGLCIVDREKGLTETKTIR